jgi:hypothetical protein
MTWIGGSEALKTVGMPDCRSDYDWVYPIAVMPKREAVATFHKHYYQMLEMTCYGRDIPAATGTQTEEVVGAQQSLMGRKMHLVGT